MVFTYGPLLSFLSSLWHSPLGVLLFLRCPRAFVPAAVRSPLLPDACCAHSLVSCGHLLNCHLIQRPFFHFLIVYQCLTHYAFISFSVLQCNFHEKRDFVSCRMSLQHTEQCLAYPRPSLICWMNMSSLGSSWWGPRLLLEAWLPSHRSAGGCGLWERLLLVAPFPAGSGLR